MGDEGGHYHTAIYFAKHPIIITRFSSLKGPVSQQILGRVQFTIGSYREGGRTFEFKLLTDREGISTTIHGLRLIYGRMIFSQFIC